MRGCCGGNENEQGTVLTKDDDGDVDRAEDTELVRLLEETVLALCVGVYGDGCRGLLIDRVLSECQENGHIYSD